MSYSPLDLLTPTPVKEVLSKQKVKPKAIAPSKNKFSISEEEEKELADLMDDD